VRNGVEGGEALVDAHRVVGAQHGHGRPQTNTRGLSRDGRQDHLGGAHGEVRAVMLPNAEKVQTDLVGQHGLGDDVAQNLRLPQKLPVRVVGDVSEGVESEFKCGSHRVRLSRGAEQIRIFMRMHSITGTCGPSKYGPSPTRRRRTSQRRRARPQRATIEGPRSTAGRNGGSPMTESDLISLWIKARWHLIVSQIAPTFLLTALVGFLGIGLDTAALGVKIGAVGILLASGILGAIVQISAANEGLAVIDDLRMIGAPSALSRRIVASAPWINVVRVGTPTIFVVVYLALLSATFIKV